MSNSNDDYQELLRQVLDLIQRHDPLQLKAIGAPSDEYEPQARAIVRHILSRDRKSHWLTIVSEIFHASFGESAGPKTRYAALAREVSRLASGLSVLRPTKS